MRGPRPAHEPPHKEPRSAGPDPTGEWSRHGIALCGFVVLGLALSICMAANTTGSRVWISRDQQ
jgi:hypothetical protein